MAFLAPLFLLGLAAIVVPIIVHLTHRQRREPIAFPSLMFLRRVEFKTTKRQRIRNRWLFAMRTLALVLLALAFARPFLRAHGDAAATGTGGGREVVVLIDDSFSMGYGDRASRARAAALEVVNGLGAGDRASVVRFAARAEALLQPTSDKGALRAAIEGVKPGSAAGRYAPALSLARSTIARAERPRREVVMVTDLQRTGWAPAEEQRLPAGVAFRIVDVGDARGANLAVTDVEFVRGGDGTNGRAEVTATARVTNLGEDAANDVPVTLVIDGREVARQAASVSAKGAASVRLGPVAMPAGVVRGAVRAGSDALEGDNVRHFTLDRGRAIGVLVLTDPAASPSRTLYLRRALAVPGNPAFRVDVRRSDEVSAADLADRSVVIVDDTRPPRGEAGRRLREMVTGGGGVLVALGERARAGDWQGEDGELLAAGVGDVVDRMDDRGGRLGALDRNHPILEPFAEPRSGNFSAPRFFRYRPLAVGVGAAAVARFDDGSVALAERRVGRGRALAWGSTFDNVWNDLPLQPVFLPLVRQLVQHAAGWSEERAWLTVGDAMDMASLAQGADSATAEYVALSPAGDQVRLTGRTASLTLDAAGIWEVRRFGRRDAPARLVAVNVDAAESDLARVPQAEVIAAVAPRDSGSDVAQGADTALPAAERESRQSLWWFLLLAAALLLAAETVVSNRLSRARRA